MTHDDETLMAYADGELDPATARAVAEAEARDPEVAARIAAFRDSRAAIAAAFGPADPVPDALHDRIAALLAEVEEDRPPAQVMDLAAARRARMRPVWQGAIAASLALVIGLGAGLSLRGDGHALDIALLADAELAPALNTAASGDRQALAQGTLSVIGTFETADGDLCREFEYDANSGSSVVAVACRAADTAWETRFAVASATAEDGYAPASSLDTLDAWMSATGAGAPMSVEDEATALRALGR